MSFGRTPIEVVKDERFFSDIAMQMEKKEKKGTETIRIIITINDQYLKSQVLIHGILNQTKKKRRRYITMLFLLKNINI